MTIAVGPLRPAHRGRVREILDSSGVFRDAEIDVALELFDEGVPGTAARDADEVPSSDYRFLGAFTPDATLVGYACWGPVPATERTYDLYWIAVAREAHGSGAGSSLLSEVERRLREAHGRLLVVETSARSDYAATRAFYERRGYGERARVRDFYAPGDDRIILTKRLDAPAAAGAGESGT